MILARTALALIAAAAMLNGSVALATSLPDCAAERVCALPLAMLAPPARPAHLVPASLTEADAPSLAEFAPPRRPAGLTLPRALAPLDPDAEPSRAEFAPPRRPAHLGAPAL